MTFDVHIWWFILTLSTSGSSVNVMGQSSRPEEENSLFFW